MTAAARSAPGFDDLVAGTNIDPATLLSTDYLNHPNEAAMLLGLAADMPEMLDELRAWRPKTYVRHFEESGLAWAPLAVECYHAAPAAVREAFDARCAAVDEAVARAVAELDALRHDPAAFAHAAARAAERVTGLIAAASAATHRDEPDQGVEPESRASAQDAIDALFP